MLRLRLVVGWTKTLTLSGSMTSDDLNLDSILHKACAYGARSINVVVCLLGPAAHAIETIWLGGHSEMSGGLLRKG